MIQNHQWIHQSYWGKNPLDLLAIPPVVWLTDSRMTIKCILWSWGQGLRYTAAGQVHNTTLQHKQQQKLWRLTLVCEYHTLSLGSVLFPRYHINVLAVYSTPGRGKGSQTSLPPHPLLHPPHFYARLSAWVQALPIVLQVCKPLSPYTVQIYEKLFH